LARTGDQRSNYIPRSLPAVGKKGVFFMNRIGPSTSELYVANVDGSNERLLLGKNSAFEYHPAFSPDGKWIIFTTERNGDGQSDLYRVKPDGTSLQKIIATSAFEDSGVLSPNGSLVAFISTANGGKGNLWVMDLASGKQWSLSNTPTVKGNTSLPDGYFRPAWSPDGQWLAFSSDRNTNWTGHGNGTGWEHTQTLSIYVIRPNGTDFRKLASKTDYSLGGPKWSPDGKRIVYHELLREDTWNAHRPESVNAIVNSIVSVDFATGTDRIVHVTGSGLKVNPHWVTNSTIGYLVKGHATPGLNYTSNAEGFHYLNGTMRSPSWSPDGKLIVYERQGWDTRPLEKKLYSWQSDWDYRFMDVFPQLSRQGKLAITLKQTGSPGNSSVISMDSDATNWKLVFDSATSDPGFIDPTKVTQGLVGAFQPAWSPDGNWVTFGLGDWFGSRATGHAKIYRAKADGSSFQNLTDGTIHSGFPSYSVDGRYIAYREWPYGLRIIDLKNLSKHVLTNHSGDNVPFWSPDGKKIVFSRKVTYTNFDVCTIRPDGTDLQCLTDSGGNDAHAVWTADGRIMYASAMYGFRDECALYDNTFQPYGQIMIMNEDGSNKQLVVESMWEDSMPLFVPNEYLGL
jgi:Tol biopolymer transport system component